METRRSLLASSIIIAGFFLHFGSPFPNSGRNQLTENLESTRVTISGDIKAADISPGGKYVAYARIISGQDSLWLRQLAAWRVLQVTTLCTDQCSGTDFSPDGNYLYFDQSSAFRWGDDLYRISTFGGEAIHARRGELGMRRIQGVLQLLKQYGSAASDDACARWRYRPAAGTGALQEPTRTASNVVEYTGSVQSPSG